MWRRERQTSALTGPGLQHGLSKGLCVIVAWTWSGTSQTTSCVLLSAIRESEDGLGGLEKQELLHSECWVHGSGEEEEVAQNARGVEIKETGLFGVDEADRNIVEKVVDFISSISYCGNC